MTTSSSPVSIGDIGGKFGTGSTGVIDTDDNFAAGVNDAGGSCSVEQELRLQGKISSCQTFGFRLYS